MHSRLTLLDGGMGKELHRIGAPFGQPEWSALALLEEPERVAEAHRNFVRAGAGVIIVNAYALVPFHLGPERFAARGRELADLAGRLARRVADEADHPVRVAASLPPLFGSYDPDSFDVAAAPELLRPLIEGQAPWVDLWIAETVGSVAETSFVRRELDRIGVAGERWLSFSLADQPGTGIPGAELDRPTLWSGESLTAAVEAAVGADDEARPADAVLLNCAAPEAITLAIGEISASLDSLGANTPIGAYANGFPPRPEVYAPNEVVLGRRDDLTPVGYAEHVRRWIDRGATIVGGCCGIHPEHIAELATLVSADPAVI